METLNIIISAIAGLATCATIVNFVLYKRQSKRIKDAEAERAETDADAAKYAMYEQRLSHANETIDQHNETIKGQSQTIADLNRALDGKTAQIRRLTQALNDAQNECNRVNDRLTEAQERITALTEQRDAERLAKERFKNWHCQNAECVNRVPPNPSLRGQKFEPPAEQPQTVKPEIVTAVNTKTRAKRKEAQKP